jgi:toxin ParE1/3/4
MGRLRFTERAESDLDSIAAHTAAEWGADQALRYLSELEACCSRLAEDRTSGRPYRALPRYWRIEQGRHVVFFRRDQRGDVLVVRILHDRMLPALHLGDDLE